MKKAMLLIAALTFMGGMVADAISLNIDIGDRGFYTRGPGYWDGGVYYVWVPGHWGPRHRWIHGHYRAK